MIIRLRPIDSAQATNTNDQKTNIIRLTVTNHIVRYVFSNNSWKNPFMGTLDAVVWYTMTYWSPRGSFHIPQLLFYYTIILLVQYLL